MQCPRPRTRTSAVLTAAAVLLARTLAARARHGGSVSQTRRVLPAVDRRPAPVLDGRLYSAVEPILEKG